MKLESKKDKRPSRSSRILRRSLVAYDSGNVRLGNKLWLRAMRMIGKEQGVY